MCHFESDYGWKWFCITKIHKGAKQFLHFKIWSKFAFLTLSQSMQHRCTDLARELDRKERKKIWKEWDKSTLCCTNWLDPLPGPTYEEEGPEVVGWFSWSYCNKSPPHSISLRFLEFISLKVNFPSESVMEYMACLDHNNIVCLFFAAFVSQGI